MVYEETSCSGDLQFLLSAVRSVSSYYFALRHLMNAHNHIKHQFVEQTLTCLSTPLESLRLSCRKTMTM